MSTVRDGGQAFPIAEGENTHRTYGMTLRDYFAGEALMGFCANSFADVDPKVAAEASYKIADAMLEARTRPEKIGDAASTMLKALEAIRTAADTGINPLRDDIWAMADSAIRCAEVAGVKVKEEIKGEVGP